MAYLPSSEAGRFQRTCQKIEKFGDDSPWAKNIIGPSFVTLAPSLLTVLAARPESLKFALEKFQINPILVIIIALSIAFAWNRLLTLSWEYVKQKAKPDKSISRNDIHSILLGLDEPVDQKIRRFEQACNSIDNNKLRKDPKSIFIRITDPESQFNALIKSVFNVFSILFEDKKFRCALAEIRVNKPKWIATFGDPPRTSASALFESSNSAFSRCVDMKSTIVVGDVEAELKKTDTSAANYVAGVAGSLQKGSVLCYPIVDPRNQAVVYVLSLHCTEKLLDDSLVNLCGWIIRPFAKRIILEHYLLTLKETSDVRKSKPR